MAARYWINGTGNWNDINHWSTTSGGVGGASVPTMNDDVYFDSNSGTGTVTVNTIANMRDCTFAQTQLITLANAAYAFNIFGNWTLCSNTYLNTSFTGTGYVYLKATTSVNITSNGCTRAWNKLHFNSGGGIWTNQDDFNVGYTFVQVGTNGSYATWKPLQYNVTVGYLSFSYVYNSLIFTSGNLTALNAIYFTNGTYGAIFDFTNCIVRSKTIQFGGYVSSMIFKEIVCEQITHYLGEQYITVDKLTIKPLSSSYLNSDLRGIFNFTINNELIIEGIDSDSKRLLLYNSYTGKPRTITCNGTITASNVDFSDIVGAGTANWDLSNIAGGSGDCGGNRGITFTPAQTQYYKHSGGGTTLWSDSTKWFADEALTLAGRIPLPQDDAVFIEGSFNANCTLSLNGSKVGSLDFRRVGYLITISGGIEIYKDYFVGDKCSCSSFTIAWFSRAVTTQVDLKGIRHGAIYLKWGKYIAISDIKTNDFGTGVEGNGSTYAEFDLNDFNLDVLNGWLQLSDGTFKTYWGNGTITVANASFSAINLNRGTVYPENAKFILYNNYPNPAYISINPTFECAYLELAGNCLNYYFQYAPYARIKELVIGAGKSLRFIASSTNHLGKLTAIGTPEQPITIGSTTAGQRHTINYTGSEASTVEYCNISDSAVVQADKLYALNSADGGNNVNWIFIVGYKMYSGANRVLKAYLGNTLLKNIYLGNESII